MDFALKRAIWLLKIIQRILFQSLFWWILLLNPFYSADCRTAFWVSILVLVDFALKPWGSRCSSNGDNVSILVLVDFALKQKYMLSKSLCISTVSILVLVDFALKHIE